MKDGKFSPLPASLSFSTLARIHGKYSPPSSLPSHSPSGTLEVPTEISETADMAAAWLVTLAWRTLMPALSHRFPHHPRASRPARDMRCMHTRGWSVLPRSAGTFKPENLLVRWAGRWWWTGGIWECLIGFLSVIVLRSFYVVHPDFELRILLPQHLKCWLWCLWVFAVVCLFPTTNKTAVKQPSKGQSGSLRQLPSRYCQTGLPYTERSRGRRTLFPPCSCATPIKPQDA